MAKPILYTEYGLRGFGFLRQNPWILTVVPAAFSTTTSVLTIIRALTGKSEPKKNRSGSAAKNATLSATSSATPNAPRKPLLNMP